MPTVSNVYKVLVASPSDVAEERQIVVDVIHEWNALNSDSRKIVLLPKMWETHSAPEYNSEPQSVINREVVDDCDIAICVLWSRLGTPTKNNESGTLEEIQRMGDSDKLVMLYFSEKPLEYDHDSSQLEKVKEFKKHTFSNGLIETFKSTNEFRDKLSRQLAIKAKSLKNHIEEQDDKYVTSTSSTSNGKKTVNIGFVKADSQSGADKIQWFKTILGYLFDNTKDNQTHIASMAKVFDIPEQKVQYYLDELEAQKLVKWSGSYSKGLKYYSLTPSGRKAYVENDI